MFTGDVKRVMDWARNIAAVVMSVQRTDDPDTLWIPQEIILSSSAIALATLADARCADARQSEEFISILRELLTHLHDLTERPLGSYPTIGIYLRI
ncbi:hypothetical protein PHLCEN_2v7458 [Hermanssonia centrifuga]|uniref:Uncharacterized protein n=1 Tax=Hermanssonia centrifuga TaxID=98765 RepID=A0A2R6NWZ4_9APHY|nr:hypothetical protein PHLCEN_2v7458 [Hermanssonia centrifuga]